VDYIIMAFCSLQTSTVTTTTKQRTVGGVSNNYGSNGLINQKQRVPPISATSTTTTISANRKFVSNSYEENEVEKS
jgi:hypothetical protein